MSSQFEEITSLRSLMGLFLVLIICATIIISISIIKDCAVQTKKTGIQEIPKEQLHESH